jgi:hypothetical protein
MKTTRTLVIGALACGLVGCGVRDTEVDGIPGPGARQPVPPAIEKHTLKPAENTKAGINSAGRPAGSAGGNPGAPEVTETPRQKPQPEPEPEPEPRDTPPRRTDIPASSGPEGPDSTPLNERKPMPNDGERANTPGSLPLPPNVN